MHGLGLSEEFVARYARLGPDARVPSAEAYRTGEPVWLASPEEIAARFPEVVAFAEREGDRAWAGIPLVADRSRGALGLRFETPHAFDAEEREFIVAVARQCAQALERSRLFEAQTRLAERLRGLQLLTAELSAALTPPEVAAILFRGLLGLGARDAGIFYLTERDSVEMVHSHSADGETVDRLARVSVDARSPVTDAIRTGEVCWLETPDAIRAVYPELEADRARRGDGAWIAVPLRLERRVVGALAFALPAGRPPRDGDRSYVLALAEQCVQALERARLFESQRRLAERLAQLHSTAAALSGAETPRRVAETAFRGLAALGACSAEIHALEGHERLVLLAHHGLPDEPPERVLAVDAPVPGRGGGPHRQGDLARVARGDRGAVPVPRRRPDAARRGRVGGRTAPRRRQRARRAHDRLSRRRAGSTPRRRRSSACSRVPARRPSTAPGSPRPLPGTAATPPASRRCSTGSSPARRSGIAFLNLEMRFQRVNAPLARSLGFSGDGHLGKTPRELLPAVAAEQLADGFARVLDTGVAADRVVVVGETHADPGATQRFVASFFPVRVGADIAGVGVLVHADPLAAR